MPEHVIWDWNGTLLDDSELCVEIMNGMLDRRGMPTLTLEAYRAAFTFPVREYYERLGFDFSVEPFEQLGIEFIDNYESRRHESRLQSDALRLLEHARSLGKAQSILSAYTHDTLVELIESHDLSHFFDHTVGLDNIYAGSKIETGLRLMDSLAHDRDKVLLVGDTLHDVEVAEEMGIRCILIAHGHQSRERLEASGVPVLETLDALVAHF